MILFLCFCAHLFGMEANIVFQEQMEGDCVKEMTVDSF